MKAHRISLRRSKRDWRRFTAYRFSFSASRGTLNFGFSGRIRGSSGSCEQISLSLPVLQADIWRRQYFLGVGEHAIMVPCLARFVTLYQPTDCRDMSFKPVLSCLILFATAAFTWLSGPGATIAQDKPAPQQFNTIQEVISNWKVDQHLYVKGKVGVSDTQLSKLEAWLDQNGKNWTIVLMDSSQGQTFETVTQERYRGREAVYYALGHGLSNQTDFGSQLHPVSQEPCGAIFVLFRKDRKFNYFASDAQDRRRLGEANWFGKLDREAIRAMRNGQRVGDAVKNTISSIDRQLNSRIKGEIRAELEKKERAELARQQALDHRKRKINHLKTQANGAKEALLPRVQAGAAKLKADFPDAESSDLANPPIKKWQTQLNAALNYLNTDGLPENTDLLSSNDFKSRHETVTTVQSQLHAFLDQLAAHASFEEQVAAVEARLDTSLFHPSKVGVELAEQGYQELELARRNHALCNFSFSQQLADVTKLAEKGEALVQGHVRQQEEITERNGVIRRTLIWVSGSIMAVLGLIMALLNYLRRKYLDEAYSVFEHCQAETEKSKQSLETLTKRSEEIIGDREAFVKANYAGLTQTNGTTSLRQLDQLASMANETDRVLAFAEQRLSPSSVLGQAANLVSSRRYQQCTQVLSSKSFELPPALELESSESSWVSFDTLLAESARRSVELTGQLDQFETCFAQLGPHLSSLNADIDRIIEKEKSLASLARRDQYFDTPALFDVLLPSLQQDWEEISNTSKTDPLTSTTVLIPECQRKIDDAKALIDAIDVGRETILPMLDDAGQVLRRLRHDTRWIDESARQLATPANQLFETAAQESVQDKAQEFHQQVRALGGRAKRTAELATQLAEKVAPSIDELETRIDQERKSIAAALGVPEASALAEVDNDPSACLQTIRSQFQSARAAVTYGGVESISESLDVIGVERSRADGLVQSSLDALKNFDVDWSNRNEVLKRLVGSIPSHQNEIEQREASFRESAFKIDAGLESNYDLLVEDADVPPSLPLLMDACRNSIQHCEQLLGSTQADQKEARVLQAANHLMLVRDELAGVEQTLAAVREHCRLMDQQNLSNEQHVPKTVERIADLKQRSTDHKVQRPTQTSIDRLFAEFEQFKRSFGDPQSKRDPFDDRLTLEHLDESQENLLLAIQADINAYQEASKALIGAESELTRAMVLLQDTADDQIPDSREIKLCYTAVREASNILEAIRNRLETAHEDWRKVDEDATKVNTRLAVTIGELRRQLQLAQQAASSLRASASAVFEAAHWRGSYGISVIGNPGSDDLDHARETLRRGEYLQTIKFANAARRSAENAVQVANSQVQAERRRIARAAEAERRRRQSSMSFSSSSGSSSFGGSSISSGSSHSISSGSSSGTSGFGNESGW